MAKQSPAQVKKWLAHSVERDRTRRELRRIKEALAAVRARRRETIRASRAQCKRLKERTRARVKEYRAAERARVNREVARMRQEARNRCAARIATIRASTAKQEEKARQTLRERKQERRELAAAKEREKIDRARVTAAEKLMESDDAVRQNLEPHLIPIFNRMRREFPGSAKMSRTEQFLHWAYENPEIVQAAEMARADREVRELIREQAKAERAAARARAKKAPPAVRVGPRERSALAIAHNAWKDRKGWAEFDDTKEKTAIKGLAKKGLAKVRKTGRRVKGYGETLEGQITPLGLDLVAGPVPF
jgi:hypothetical protein